MPNMGRRNLLKLTASTAALAALPAMARPSSDPASTASNGGASVVSDAVDKLRVSHGPLTLGFDEQLRSRLLVADRAITAHAASEVLLRQSGDIASFRFTGHRVETIHDAKHGSGQRHLITARSNDDVVKQVELCLYPRYPGMVVLQVEYQNDGKQPLDIRGWRNGAHELPETEDGFWTFSGTTHEDRRDWVQPLGIEFEQRNTLGMDASDYGGGTPVADVWRRDVGIAVGHLEPVVRLLDLPVSRTAHGASLALESNHPATLAPGASLRTDRTLLCVHRGDYFVALQRYQAYMADQGMVAPMAPGTAFAPVWCAWGYGRNFNREQILATLPKVRDMGFGWAVLDDGWQTNEGDWHIDRRKFPRGEQDMREFAAAVKQAGLLPRLWLAPLAADPGSDILHDHPDMLLLDQDGSVQKVSWWNAFTQCPAYQPTIDYYIALVRKILGEWGFEGIKFDG
ncbi:MAG TPA: glycoside hydrolase family 36 protein, partial [Rhodanobacteraceae bacterium]|nr:glycoside hydrolase family 36 protein [Rhodanobacteraceae bacterium]